jgi:hypothetical protein
MTGAGGAGYQAVQFVLLSLAAYRLWRLAGADTVSDRLRGWLAGRFGEVVREFFECPWCSGTWIALIITIVTAVVGDVAVPVLQSLAASAVVGTLGERSTATTAFAEVVDDNYDGEA